MPWQRKRLRVAIARALCMNPEIMLFDEPTSALDPEMISEVADAIVFMDAGEIVEADRPDAFFNNPRSDRTKLFVGQILTH